jgi:type VI secretion system secreted protein Hcp
MSTNMFLQFTDAKMGADPLKGEAADEKHAGWIEIVSWNHSFEQPPTNFRTSTGSTVEKCKHENMSVTKYIDTTTTTLLKCVWGGKQLDKAVIACYRADTADGTNVPVEYLNVEMADVVIANYSISGGEGDMPQEELGLAYGSITYKYTYKDKDTGAAGEPKVAKVSLIDNKVE